MSDKLRFISCAFNFQMVKLLLLGATIPSSLCYAILYTGRITQLHQKKLVLI